MFRTSNFCLPVAAAVFAICVSAPASAIDSRKGYQRVQGNWIATPYCQDQYLSEVATVYGVSAPAAKLPTTPTSSGTSAVWWDATFVSRKPATRSTLGARGAAFEQLMEFGG